MKVVILNGGKGTRLGLTDRPKPMVSLGGRPLLDHLIAVAKDSGFRDFVFLNGHLAHVIEDYFGDGSAWGVHIEHVRELAPVGTAGAVRDSRHLLTGSFVLLYGDILIDVDLARFAEFHRSHKALVTLFVHPNDHPYDSDLLETDEEGRVRRFFPKPHPKNTLMPNLVSAAICVVDPEAISYIPESGETDWGRDVFPKMVASGEKLMTYRSLEYAKDVGTSTRLLRAEADLSSGRVSKLSRRRPKPAIFLDRDGVINAEIGGVHRPEDVTLLGGVGAALRKINQAGVPAICVTNQPDFAKGFLSNDAYLAVSKALDTALASAGAYLDITYHCPHHPERGWPGEVVQLKIACLCRKPQPGMLFAAARDHNLDLSRSWMIGDRLADVEAAKLAGCRSVLVRTGYAGADSAKYDGCIPDRVCDNLLEATGHVLDAIR